MTETFQLARFVDAQAKTFSAACDEMAAGRKTTHWMWFIFPQLKGLGHSPTSQNYGLASRAEAQAYLAHPILGPRLVQATGFAMSVEDRSLRDIFGSPDDLKFISCMTLFDAVAPSRDNIFAHALDKFSGGKRDARTLALLAPGT